MIGAVLMNNAYFTSIHFRIEEKARDLGMVYPEEITVFQEEDPQDDR